MGNIDDLEDNLRDYCKEIKEYTRQKNYKDALILVSGLRKFILDLKNKKGFDKKQKSAFINGFESKIDKTI